jgi:hypothetical protein
MTTPGYERQKRYRARTRSGRIVLPIEIDFGAVGDLLVAAGFLADWDLSDRGAIKHALEAALDFWAQA